MKPATPTLPSNVDSNGSKFRLEATKVIEETVSKLGVELSEQIQEFQTASEERRVELEKSMQHLQGQIEGLTAAVEKRPNLNGVQTTKTGEKGKFSMGRFFKIVAGVVKKDDPVYGYEREVCKAMEDKYDDLPLEIKAAINAATDSGGAFLIPQEVQDSIVPELEAQEIAMQLGVTVLNGLVGNVSWVVDSGGISAVYVNTEEEETGAESVPVYNMFELRPHVLAAFVPLTHIMLTQSAIALDQWVSSRMAKKIALREDKSIFLGDSASSEPRGILNFAGIGTVDWSDVNTAPEWSGTGQLVTSHLLDHYKELALANVTFSSAPGLTRIGWACEPEVAFAIAKTKDEDGRNIFIEDIGGGMISTLMGRPFQFSTQLTNAVTTEQRLLCGDFSECILGRWGTLAFAASDETETNFRKLRRTIRAVMAHDVALTHPAAFINGTGVVTASAA